VSANNRKNLKKSQIRSGVNDRGSFLQPKSLFRCALISTKKGWLNFDRFFSQTHLRLILNFAPRGKLCPPGAK
jgi:hypothetical protein